MREASPGISSIKSHRGNVYFIIKRAVFSRGRFAMMLNMTDQEVEYLIELLDNKYKQLIHEINHTDAREYKQMLRSKLDLLEGISSKLKAELEQSKE
jgi:hypothetical protein